MVDPTDVIYVDAARLRRYHVQTDAPVIGLKLGEMGYWPIYTPAPVLDLNGGELSEEIFDSAIGASLFGWDCPIATPAREYLEGRTQPAHA